MDAGYRSVLEERAGGNRAGGIHILDWMSDLRSTAIRRLFDQHIDLYQQIDEMTARQGLEILPIHDPKTNLRLVQGGTAARNEYHRLVIAGARGAAVKAKMLPHVTKLLDLRGWIRGHKILHEKMLEAFHKGDYAAYAMYKTKMARGEAMPAGYTPAKAQAKLIELEKSMTEAEWAQAEDLASKLWEPLTKARDEMYKEGLLTDQVYKDMVRRGKDYIPLHRLQHDELRQDPDWGYFGGFDRATLLALHRLEGSPLPTVDPYEGAYNLLTKINHDIGVQQVMRSIFYLKELDPNGFFGKNIRELVPGEKPPHDWVRLTFRRKGEKVPFAMPREIAHSLEHATPKEVSLVEQFGQLFKKGLQVGAVGANIAFAAPNLARDMGELMALSHAGSVINPKRMAKVAVQIGKTIGHILRRDEAYMQFLYHRAANSTFTKAIAPEYFAKDLPWKRGLVKKAIRLPLTVPMEAVAFTEELTKFTGYAQLIDDGWTPERAAAETREYAGTPDFAVRGTSTYAANLAIPFFGVRARGKARFWNRIARNPKKLAQLIAASMLVSMILYRCNAQYRDEKGEPEMDHVPEDIKRNNWVFMTDHIDEATGRRKYATIRKPESFQVIANPMERALHEVMERQGFQGKDFWQMVTDFGQAGIPFFPDIDVENEGVLEGTLRSIGASVNPGLKEPVEQFANYDFYRRIPMIPKGEEGLDPRLQVGPYTSPTAQSIGNALGISPRRVEHAIEGTLAGVGEQALSVADYAGEATGLGLPRTTDEMPILSQVGRRFWRQRPRDAKVDRIKADFYDNYKEAEQVLKSYNDILSDRSLEAADAYVAEKPGRRELMGRVGKFRSMSRRLKLSLKAYKVTITSPDLTDEEKNKAARIYYDDHLAELAEVAEFNQEIMMLKLGAPPPAAQSSRFTQPPPQ
jgi:hypothetical protein